LPGVRELSARRGVSVATILAAYRRLEDDGLLEARARSGFYVRTRRAAQAPEPRVPARTAAPRLVNGKEMALALLHAASTPGIIRLGAAVPAPEFLPVRAVTAALARAARAAPEDAANYMMPPGHPELRRQIARRMNEAGADVHADDVLITTG